VRRRSPWGHRKQQTRYPVIPRNAAAQIPQGEAEADATEKVPEQRARGVLAGSHCWSAPECGCGDAALELGTERRER
jgi:hypothetical protein